MIEELMEAFEKVSSDYKSGRYDHTYNSDDIDQIMDYIKKDINDIISTHGIYITIDRKD